MHVILIYNPSIQIHGPQVRNNAKISYPPGATELIPVFNEVAQCAFFCAVFWTSLLVSSCPFSFSNCIVFSVLFRIMGSAYPFISLVPLSRQPLHCFLQSNPLNVWHQWSTTYITHCVSNIFMYTFIILCNLLTFSYLCI